MRIRMMLALMLAAAFLAACGGGEAEDGPQGMEEGSSGNEAAMAGTESGEELPTLEVHMTRTCGCCGGWVEHSQEEDFDSLRNYLDQDQLNRVKAEQGVPREVQSCHTAVSGDGYVFEGHIPARVIHEFLDAPPENAIGLAVPGMPIGSPGMEMGDRFAPYDVLLINEDGSTEVYTRIASADQQ